MLAYFVKEQYRGIYNIVRINEQPTKDWISVDWINENVIDKLKAFIREETLVETICGECCSLNDEMGNYDLLIPTHENKKVRLKLWELASQIYPNRLPQKAELEFWYNSLWEECHNFKIEDLIDKVENIGNLTSLENLLGSSCYDWLKAFYSHIFNKDYGVEQNALKYKNCPKPEW